MTNKNRQTPHASPHAISTRIKLYMALGIFKDPVNMKY